MHVAGRMLFAFVIALVSVSAMSLQRDDDANDMEIRIGNLMPYTGPLAEFSAIGKAEAAYFDMINNRGGVNGRKVRFISYDDNSDPTSLPGIDDDERHLGPSGLKNNVTTAPNDSRTAIFRRECNKGDMIFEINIHEEIALLF